MNMVGSNVPQLASRLALQGHQTGEVGGDGLGPVCTRSDAKCGDSRFDACALHAVYPPSVAERHCAGSLCVIFFSAADAGRDSPCCREIFWYRST